MIWHRWNWIFYDETNETSSDSITTKYRPKLFENKSKLNCKNSNFGIEFETPNCVVIFWKLGCFKDVGNYYFRKVAIIGNELCAKCHCGMRTLDWAQPPGRLSILDPGLSILNPVTIAARTLSLSFRKNRKYRIWILKLCHWQLKWLKLG